MTKIPANQPFPVRASDVKTQAAAWFEKRHFWSWDEKDQAEFDAWIAQSLAHRAAYVRVDAMWQRTELLSAIRPAPEAPRKILFPVMLKLAAAFVAATVIGAGAFAYLAQPRERVFSTGIGGHETVTFADGSKVELNTNTALRALMTTAERTVWLDKGEAYFQIKHDSAHPFVVMVGTHRVTDLGTKFTVRREVGKTQVAVIQGRVTFDAPDSLRPSQVALLTAGDVATATATDVSIHRENGKALSTELSWRRGMLVFDKVALGQAAAEFNRYNREQIVVADPSVANRIIDGTFRTEDVELFARMAQVALGLHVEDGADKIVITR